MADGFERYAEVDDGAAPIVVVRVVGPITERGFTVYEEELIAAIRRHERVALRFEHGRLRHMPPRFISASAQWFRTHHDELSQRVVGAAFVLSTSPLRIALQGLAWAAPVPFEMTASASIEEADAWLLAKLEEQP